MIYYLIFFFSSRRRHTRYIGDWSSDVCSSDLMEDSFARMDGAKLSSIQVAITKAESAAIRRMATGPAMEGDKRSEERRVGKECRSWWWMTVTYENQQTKDE